MFGHVGPGITGLVSTKEMYLCGYVNQTKHDQQDNFNSSKPPIHVSEFTTPPSA